MLDLDDLSWVGWAEFSRQWILLSRREAYIPGTGEHRLWFDLGGSAGQQSRWALDVEEGTDCDDRHWNVELLSAEDAKREKKCSNIRERILEAASNFPDGETKTVLETPEK